MRCPQDDIRSGVKFVCEDLNSSAQRQILYVNFYTNKSDLLTGSSLDKEIILEKYFFDSLVRLKNFLKKFKINFSERGDKNET